MSDDDIPVVPDGCEVCPNRRKEQSDRTKGKWGAYVFALMLGVLVLMFSIEQKPNGTYYRTAEPPVLVWGVLLPMMAVCLGVQVDPEQIGQAIARATTK